MWMLIHGNGRSSESGGISPQLLDRVERAAAAFATAQTGPDSIRRVCFFAADRYADGSSASEYVKHRFAGITDQLLVCGTAYSTVDEVRQFAQALRADPEPHSVCVATASYHLMRSRILLWRSFVFPTLWIQSPVGDPADVLLEPLKLAKDLFMIPVHERSAYGAR